MAKVNAEDELLFIEFKWDESRVDTLGYKPYSPRLVPQNVFIRVAVPNTPKYVNRIEGGKKARKVTLTLDGWGYVQAELGKVFQRINPNLK